MESAKLRARKSISKLKTKLNLQYLEQGTKCTEMNTRQNHTTLEQPEKTALHSKQNKNLAATNPY